MAWTDSILNEKGKPKASGSWSEKISALKALIKETGPLWPSSTRLAGYGESGPYHCGECKYLVDEEYCKHPVIVSDPQVKKDEQGRPLVNAEHGCCEFVDPGKE